MRKIILSLIVVVTTISLHSCDTSSHVSGHGGQYIDFSKNMELKREIDEEAETVASKMQKCCSMYVSKNIFTKVDYSAVQKGFFGNSYTIPMTVFWSGKITGKQYYIRGILNINEDGTKEWKHISDSGGLESKNCMINCIEQDNVK